MTVALRTNHDEIIQKYGERFTRIVGADLIARLLEVKFQHFDRVRDYPTGLKPSDLGNHSAVRGTMQKCKRNFIAIKVDLYNRWHQHIATVVELVFQRYTNDKDKYCCCPNVASDVVGKGYYSTLSTAEMEDNHLGNMRELLRGHEIKSVKVWSTEYLVQMHNEKGIIPEEQESRLNVIQKYCTMNLLEISNDLMPSSSIKAFRFYNAHINS